MKSRFQKLRTVETQAFAKTVASIRRANYRLGHRQGWRFLYGPKATFSRKTRLFLIAINPGGRHYQRGLASVEEGNAYRGVELWHWNKRMNKFQTQICRMSQEIASRLGVERDTLMDEMLVSNLCPFRSPRIEEMNERLKERSIAYSIALWSKIFDVILPRVIICVGGLVYEKLLRILLEKGFNAKATLLPTGWGKISYRLTTLGRKERSLLLVGLPHLSTFAIFRENGSQSQFRPLWRAVIRYLK